MVLLFRLWYIREVSLCFHAMFKAIKFTDNHETVTVAMAPPSGKLFTNHLNRKSVFCFHFCEKVEEKGKHFPVTYTPPVPAQVLEHDMP